MMQVDTLTDLRPRTDTSTWTGAPGRHSDADSIRREYGLAAWDTAKWDWPSVVPGSLMHAKDNSAYSPPGGTDFLAVGPPGAGKTTLFHNWAARLLEVNDEAVVYRASTSRSEWVRFAPWAKVCVPSSCNREVVLEDQEGDRRTVKLEDVAREVMEYDDVRDLNQTHLEQGKFHVVYPDPQMRGCQAVYQESSKQYELEFKPSDPVKHWWVAWLLDRVENGPYFFTSLLLDEVGDLISQDASKDEFHSYEKVLLFRDAFVDARKFFLSVYMAGHSEEDIHEKLRRKVRWRITLNGTANPTRGGQVVGWNNVPMNTDLSSRMATGRGLFFTEQNFDPSFGWSDIPKPTHEVLKVRLEPKRAGGSRESEAVHGGVPS
jgi:hypothetical protein